MKYFWILTIFWLFLFNSSNSYIFTQDTNRNTYVCEKPKTEFCTESDVRLLDGPEGKELPMNLGFWKDATLTSPFYKFSEFGFPIFYEYILNDNKLNVNMIIINGMYDASVIENGGKYFYISLIDEERICKSARPKKEEETLTGGLYLNEKYAKFAYFIYHSSSKSLTCILSIKFEDLRQGNYDTKELVSIQAKEIHLIENEVENFIDPLFSIDPIFGTMVFFTLVRGDIWKAVHYKIDENDLAKLQVAFSDELSPIYSTQEYEWRKILSYLRNPKKMFQNDRNLLFPAFSSYGKSIFMFFPKFDGKGIVAFWAANVETKEPASFLVDDHRRLFIINSNSFENGEPIGKFIYTEPAAPPPKTTLAPKCNRSLYLGLFITFAIIDFILMLALLSLGFLIWFGSKKMKKFRQYQINKRYGKQQSNIPGAPKTTVLGISAVTAGTMVPETVAPTNLNTQDPTKATTIPQTQVGGTKATGIVKNGKQQTTQGPISAPVGTTAAGKTTKLQTWESKQT